MPTTEAEVEAYSSIVEPVLNNLEGRLQSVEMQRAGPPEERIRSGLKENYPDLTDEEINLRTHELMRNVRVWLGDVKTQTDGCETGCDEVGGISAGHGLAELFPPDELRSSGRDGVPVPVLVHKEHAELGAAGD